MTFLPISVNNFAKIRNYETMTAHELNDQLIRHQWTGDPYWNNGEYIIPRKIRYALVLSLQDPSLADETSDAPLWIGYEADNKVKADERFAHQYDPVPRNKTIDQLMQEYNTRGRKVSARVQLKKRVEFVSFDEQKLVLLAFLNNASVDRKFALKYLDEHWDEFYASEVEHAWQQYHDKEAAKLIVHHFSNEFVRTNCDALTVDFNYLQVRLRLPADSAIDRDRLSDSAYLYLCARQSLEVDDKTTEYLFYQNVLKAISWFYIKSPRRLNPNWANEEHTIYDQSLCDIPVISSMVWSLGTLGKSDILIRFTEFHEKVYPLIMQSKWDEVRTEFNRLGFYLNYLEFEEAVKEYDQRIIDMNRPPEDFELKALPDDLDLNNFTLSNDPNVPF
jgi:hypothetical protein